MIKTSTVGPSVIFHKLGSQILYNCKAFYTVGILFKMSALIIARAVKIVPMVAKTAAFAFVMMLSQIKILLNVEIAWKNLTWPVYQLAVMIQRVLVIAYEFGFTNWKISRSLFLKDPDPKK